jgi:uncharacterized protein (UPF0335 family)
MPDEGEEIQVEHQPTAGKWILIILAVAFVAASVYGYVTTQQHVDKLTKDLGDSQAQVAELKNRMQTAEASEDALAHQVGLTKKELAQRAAQLQAEQKIAESRLEKEEKEAKEQIGQVSGEVAGVKTDVGGVKTDVASTKADLEATKAKLQSAVGDLGVQSGLIATTRGDLEVLKHRGDRNYYEFTLLRGREAAACGDGEPSAQKDGRQAREVHVERDLRRQDNREEGSQHSRTDSVLLGTRSPAV